MARKALIVIDLQNDYFPGGKFPLVGTEAAAANAARLIAAARQAGDLVIHVRHESPADSGRFFAAGTPGAQTHDLVRAVPEETVVVKNRINAFRDTNLKALLDDAGVEDITIAGAMSHMCIDAATRAAADFGYRVTVVHDAVATRDLEFDGQAVSAAQVHAAFMAALAFAYARVVATEAYLAPVAA